MFYNIIGYFTSRPALKGYIREMNSLLQVCKQLEVFGMKGSVRTGTASSYTLRKKATACLARRSMKITLYHFPYSL